MKKISETIIFFGSGPVAAQSLEQLNKWISVEVVVTKPQPPHHKEQFPVLMAAKELGLKVLTPNSKQELSELFYSYPPKSKLGIVIDYGFIINQDVINRFKYGIINSHFSLLPEWRGPDPISFSILSGQKRTGISLMLISIGMDEGPLLAQSTYDLPKDITYPQLTNDLIELSDKTLQHIIPLYIDGKIDPAPQESVTIASNNQPTYSRKLSKGDGILDWHKPALQLEREIRAYSEWPKSRTTLAGKDVIITKAHHQIGNGQMGSVWKEDKTFGVYTSSGILVIDRIKPAGKPEMSDKAFLAGYGKDLK